MTDASFSFSSSLFPDYLNQSILSLILAKQEIPALWIPSQGAVKMKTTGYSYCLKILALITIVRYTGQYALKTWSVLL